MSITFKDLENLKITAESKTLSEASEKLGMAQPSLSLGIKKLEKELGYELFIRGRDGLKLTPRGKAFLPDALQALELLDKMKGQKTALKFRIGCHHSVGMFVLGDFLKLMHASAPHLNFEIVNGSSHDINRMVAQGSVDFGVVMNPLPIQGLINRQIGDDDVYVWEAKGRWHDRLIYHPQMLQANSILSRWKSAPAQSIEVQNLELIGNLVQSGAGIGILPGKVVEAQRLNLQRVKDTPSFKDHLALVCYPEMIKGREGKLIFEMLKQAFSKEKA